LGGENSPLTQSRVFIKLLKKWGA